MVVLHLLLQQGTIGALSVYHIFFYPSAEEYESKLYVTI